MSSASARIKATESPHRSAASMTEAGGISVSPALFRKFQVLINRETGIWLGDSKVPLLCGRLSRRLRALGIAQLDQYYELVTQPEHHEERVSMIDAITTNETRFFRDARHFEFLEQRVISNWCSEAKQGLRTRKVTLWSAGCSSGEEPFSLAMLLAQSLPIEEGWKATILATDISTRMLEHARLAVYSLSKAAEIPGPLLHNYMLKGIGENHGKMKVMPNIRLMVEFQGLNLIRGPFPPPESFDVIFCRNVLIYFDTESKQKAVEELTRCLAPHGLLFVGQSENLSSVKSQLRSLAPAVYTRVGEQSGF